MTNEKKKWLAAAQALGTTLDDKKMTKHLRHGGRRRTGNIACGYKGVRCTEDSVNAEDLLSAAAHDDVPVCADCLRVIGAYRLADRAGAK
jgi:hypothetical protein